LLTSGKIVRAAYDQFFCPIALDDLVTAIVELQKKGAKGTFHVCGNDFWSRLDLANALGRSLNADMKLIHAISIDDLKEPFQRPKKIRMVNQKVFNHVKLTIRPLQSSIETIASQYTCK
jgi:dTDP-4-dehydrorhamnose reductase